MEITLSASHAFTVQIKYRVCEYTGGKVVCQVALCGWFVNSSDVLNIPGTWDSSRVGSLVNGRKRVVRVVSVYRGACEYLLTPSPRSHDQRPCAQGEFGDRIIACVRAARASAGFDRADRWPQELEASSRTRGRSEHATRSSDLRVCVPSEPQEMVRLERRLDSDRAHPRREMRAPRAAPPQRAACASSRPATKRAHEKRQQCDISSCLVLVDEQIQTGALINEAGCCLPRPNR
eukprot:6188251-Pleurochrysis_carterae.AAC.2